MTTHDHPDLFTNVHKGIRRALFAACSALGSSAGDAGRERKARALLGEALHFVHHHGENEDLVLLPLIAERAPAVHARMVSAHAALDLAREDLAGDLPIDALYLAACAFTAQYLAHMDDEERVFEARILAILSTEEAADFGRRSVERTAPADQRMMLGWMLPAMTRRHAQAFLDRVPAAAAAELRALVD